MQAGVKVAKNLIQDRNEMKDMIFALRACPSDALSGGLCACFAGSAVKEIIFNSLIFLNVSRELSRTDYDAFPGLE
jgi:hypothetical protein